MDQSTASTPRKPTPPRAAAVAGVIFSVLMAIGLTIVRLAVPRDLVEPDVWLTDPLRKSAVYFAINSVPFAGIAFLWHMGVVRNRLGRLEDQFFSTVFLSSGLLFVASLFVAGASSRALVEAVASGGIDLSDSETYRLVRRFSSALLNVFGIKMAAVFMFSTCAMALRTLIFPRWMAFSGFGCGLILLIVYANWDWIVLVFPAWMLLVSLHILIADLHRIHDK